FVFPYAYVAGPGYYRAEDNSAYVIGKDFWGRKRIEGRLRKNYNSFKGKVILYYKNGNVKRIMFYSESGKSTRVGVWKYYDRKGNLVKEKSHT
ncbi:MAG: hypothetical protein ACHQII_02955, partial [Bacteroidia bacterium]